MEKNDTNDRGVWLNSSELHDLRDHIQAIRVGFALLRKEASLDESTRQEIHGGIAESIEQLASSSFFKRTSALNCSVHRKT